MDTARRIAKNTILLLVSQIIVSILFFLSMLYSARYLGATGFGILSTALALTAILGLFSDLGLNTLTTREVSRNTSLADKYLPNMLLMKLVLAFVTFGSIALVSNLFYSQEVLHVVYILSLSTILDSFSSTFYSIFQAYEKMEYQALGKALGSFLLFAGTIISIYYGLTVLAFAYVYFITSLIILVYTSIICVQRFFLLPKIEVDLKFWKTIIMKALPLSLVLIFGVVYFRIDMVLLSIIKGNAATGIYSAAYRLMDFMTFVPVVFTTSILPVMSKFYLSSKDSLKISYKLSFKYMVILGLPIAVGITILAKDIILLIYTADFEQSIFSLQILIWTIPVLFLTYLLSTVITSINKQNVLCKVMFLSMLANIVLNLTLIPLFSYLGSSLVTLISELIVFVLCFYYVSKFVCKIEIQNLILKPAVASVVMGLFLVYVHINLFLTILIAFCIYLVVLIILKTFSKEELVLFKNVLGKSNDK